MNIIIKLFIVLCCNTQTPDGVYSYQVKELPKDDLGGIVYTTIKYQEGDTIRIRLNVKN